MKRIDFRARKLASAAPKAAPLATSSLRSTHRRSVWFALIGGLAILASATVANCQVPILTPIPFPPISINGGGGKWICSGCMGASGPTVIGGTVYNYDTLWDISVWPNQTNPRLFQAFENPGIVGIAQEPNNPNVLYALNTGDIGLPNTYSSISQVSVGSSSLYMGPATQLMLPGGKLSAIQSEGDIAFHGSTLYGISNSGLLFSVPLPLENGSEVVNELGTLPCAGCNYTAMAFDSNGNLYVLDSGNSTIYQVSLHGSVVESYHFTNPSLYSSAASMSFFGQSFPNVYIIQNGSFKQVNLNGGSNAVTVLGPSTLDRGVVGTLTYTGGQGYVIVD
jgi:hypothetical protein